MRRMATTIEHINSSKAETAAHTLTYENVEVPNSNGAKAVHVVRVEMHLDEPQHVAASTTAVMGLMVAGKITPTTALLNQVGALTQKTRYKYSNGASAYAAETVGPEQAQGRWEVPKYPGDGKFYITPVVCGSATCTAALTVYYRVDFEVER